MSKQIEVLKINRSKAGKAGTKGYNVVEVAYKDPEGKTKGMKVLDFVQREVFSSLEGVNDGDYLDVEFEQNDKGYWQFKSVQKGEKPVGTTEGQKTSSSSGSSTGRTGNWETAEERAARQVMIVRQSSLSTAVQLLALRKDKAGASEVIEVAKQFESFVMGTQPEVARGDVQ